MARKDSNVNTVGQVLDIKKAVCREFDTKEIIDYLAGTGYIRMSWAFEKPEAIVKKKAIRFLVSGHHHKGYVYIVLGFMDTFDIYYTDKLNVIVKISNDVYIMDLVDILDTAIERLPQYTR
jgi:hypothetical protein